MYKDSCWGMGGGSRLTWTLIGSLRGYGNVPLTLIWKEIFLPTKTLKNKKQNKIVEDIKPNNYFCRPYVTTVVLQLHNSCYNHNLETTCLIWAQFGSKFNVLKCKKITKKKSNWQVLMCDTYISLSFSMYCNNKWYILWYWHMIVWTPVIIPVSPVPYGRCYSKMRQSERKIGLFRLTTKESWRKPL